VNSGKQKRLEALKKAKTVIVIVNAYNKRTGYVKGAVSDLVEEFCGKVPLARSLRYDTVILKRISPVSTKGWSVSCIKYGDKGVGHVGHRVSSFRLTHWLNTGVDCKEI